MKLHFNPASPYVRKVLVVAQETGLAERIERVDCLLSPVAPNLDLVGDNPLGKVPTLVTDEGVALYDSRVICEYLDSIHGAGQIFPVDGTRWRALTLQSLADGMLDAAVGNRYETILRPPEYRWADWSENQLLKFRRALDLLETNPPGDAANIGTLSVAIALGYLDFRYGDEQWRATRPRLTAWYETFADRPSLRATMPADA